MEEIESVNEFRCLGALINNDGRDDEEIKSRIGKVKNATNILIQVLGN